MQADESGYLQHKLPCVERVIGSIRREFLDRHVIVIRENHLRKLIKEYFHYYNYQRTHLGIDKDSPVFTLYCDLIVIRSVISIYPARLSHGSAGGVEGISSKLRIGQYRRNIEAISGE